MWRYVRGADGLIHVGYQRVTSAALRHYVTACRYSPICDVTTQTPVTCLWCHAGLLGGI